MKIRSDYVTNSSSSSFLLSFKDENSIYETLKEQFPEEWADGEGGYLEELFDEITKAKHLSKDDVISIIKDESYEFEWDLFHEIQRRKNMSYGEAYSYVKSERGQRILNQRIGERIKDVLDTIGDNEIVVEVEHGDGGEGEDGVLEQGILPCLDCTAVRFSHH